VPRLEIRSAVSEIASTTRIGPRRALTLVEQRRPCVIKEVRMMRHPRPLVTVCLMFAALVVARPALAGPPLLCHPFDIGTARSLPWTGPGWFDAKPDYHLDSLVADTEALLGPSTP